MKIKYNNNVVSVENNESGVVVDGVNYDIRIQRIDDKRFKVIRNDEEFIATGVKDKDKFYVSIGGKQYVFTELEDEFISSSQSDDRAEIFPPMPGAVVKILVNVGDKVEPGDNLIIVEAMKMETTLHSPISGKIKEIRVSEKEQVNPENYMILIEKV